jgi:hypothetical protein
MLRFFVRLMGEMRVKFIEKNLDIYTCNSY